MRSWAKGPFMNQSLAVSRAGAYASLAAFLVTLPTKEMMDDLRRLACAVCGDGCVCDFSDVGDAIQVFHDRTSVTCSARFVPLSEQCVYRAECTKGESWTYGPVTGSRSSHVLACYRKAGFGFKGIQGFEPVVRSLRPDSLAAECAFMAYLLNRAACCSQSAESDEQFADAFLREHLSSWVGRAADMSEQTGNDYYAFIVRLCASFVRADVSAMSA
ncbi:hypothetical protein DMP06_00550 [Slackia equolifaciens]|uniref:Molecular chaperone TorD n=2 Tax=Slackia equolifaciens TaxID=498718 RepID=A0A3N0B499_9ACTN|nr:hypothetical protein DMP06_00550 [Slackia equolifaciens]